MLVEVRVLCSPPSVWLRQIGTVSGLKHRALTSSNLVTETTYVNRFMKLIDLFEMPMADVYAVERDLVNMFDDIGIRIKFTTHFEDRISDGDYRGDAITKEELLAVFKKLKKKQEQLVDVKKDQAAKKDHSKFEGVIRDELTNLNVPFGLEFNRNSGKFILSLITAMKKEKKFHPKPNDVVITV